MIRHQPGCQHAPCALLDPEPSANDALRLRLIARTLLRRLIADRASSAERFREAGCRDAIEVVTGRTSFDNAIAATRQMISRMDAMLADFARETRWSSEASLEPNEVTIHL